MNKERYDSWRSVVPTLGGVLERMNEKTLIAVGALPYQWIPLGAFVDNLNIYCVKNVAEVELLRNYATITCLEEFAPKVGARVQATNYLLGNYVFQGFLNSRKYPFRLMLRQTNAAIMRVLEAKGWDWVGNKPDSFEKVLVKAGFRDLLKQLELPHLEDWRLSREEFLQLTFEGVYAHWNSSVVIQRADVEVGGVDGTFFIHSAADWQAAYKILEADTRYTQIQISPFIQGHALSMLGCVTHMGVLTSALQLQLIDVPEALGTAPATGTFMGHDWGFRSWSDETEKTAQVIVEQVGAHLAALGYKGVFGIDFMYDTASQRLYPIECNPRPTGAMPVISLMTMRQGQVPPLEFFHLMTQLGLYEFFYFDQVNEALKLREPVAHLAISPRGITSMPLTLRPGIYSYQERTRRLHFERPGALIAELQSPEEFIIIDSIPRIGQPISQNVPRLFKFIFNRSIAQASNIIDEPAQALVSALVSKLRQESPA